MKLLLDTCTFIWLCSSPDFISESAKEILSNHKSSLYLSDASVMEIAIKHSLKKLELPDIPEEWIKKQTDIWQIDSLDISKAVIYESCKLPLLHKDPFDRLIISTAKAFSLTLLTPDPYIRKYPVKTIW